MQVWFTGQNNRPLEIEDSVNITLIIGQLYKNEIFSRSKVQEIR